MKRFLIMVITAFLMAMPVHAMDITAPEVPESGEALLRGQPETFSEGLWALFKEAVALLEPSLADASGVCLQIAAMAVLVSVVKLLPGTSSDTVELIGVIAAAAAMLQPAGTLIHAAADTVRELSEYGKLLIPVMTAALAAHGGLSASTALYTGTVIFDAVLSSLISNVIVPAVYIFLCLGVASCALDAQMTEKLKGFVKWLMTWMLKIVLYVFTGFIAITGVVSGSVDATALKATKLTISGAVPVVGGILSDASEAVLVSAGVMKNAAGVYGLLAILAVWAGPFLRIGAQYLLLKGTGAFCGTMDARRLGKTVQDFASGMGLLLAMTGAVCLFLMISVVCFMRGGYQ